MLLTSELSYFKRVYHLMFANIIESNKLASTSNTNSQTEIQYGETVNNEVTTNGATIDDQFEEYNYIYSKGVVTIAETNVFL